MLVYDRSLDMKETSMRGADEKRSDETFTASPEQLVPLDHPLRAIKAMADAGLANMSPLFDASYALYGRPSIPPERLLRALLLQILYSVRSERMLVEQLQYNMLFRWFVGMNGQEPVWDPTTYTKNRKRFLEGDVALAFFNQVMDQATTAGLVSEEHFSVDGTLIQAWASFKSLTAKDGSDEDRPPPDDPGNPAIDFKGEKRTNATHVSATDPDARMYKKSKGAATQMAYLGHILMENRHGLVTASTVTLATGTAEREAGLAMIGEVGNLNQTLTLGGDKGYDTAEFVAALRDLNVTPHVAQNDTNRKSAIDGRTTRHEGYKVSKRKRMRIEEIFGWMKTVGLFRKTRHKGIPLVDWMFTFTTAAYNLVRMRKLLAAA
jgi:transposase